MAKLQRGYGPTLRLFHANCINREKYEYCMEGRRAEPALG